MGAGIIIQARLTSKRFPNKMLCPLLGKPVLQHTIDACLRTKFPIVIAIPQNKTDVGLTAWLYEHYTDKQIQVGYGNKEDLVLRFKQVNKAFKFDPIIRICGDTPFIDPDDIYHAMNRFEGKNKYQRVNNIEVFSREELEYVSNNDPFISRREHCVLMLNQTVDYPEDIDRLENEYSKSQQPISKNAEINPEGSQFGET